MPRVIHPHHIYHHAKFELSSFSSLRNTNKLKVLAKSFPQYYKGTRVKNPVGIGSRSQGPAEESECCAYHKSSQDCMRCNQALASQTQLRHSDNKLIRSTAYFYFPIEIALTWEENLFSI